MNSSSSDNAKFVAGGVYALYLLSFFLGFTSLVGVIVAYIFRGDAPQWLGSHHHFQIRTFWIGLLVAVVAIPLTLVLIGYPILMLGAVWLIIRCVNGLRHLLNENEYPRPYNWIW